MHQDGSPTPVGINPKITGPGGQQRAFSDPAMDSYPQPCLAHSRAVKSNCCKTGSSATPCAQYCSNRFAKSPDSPALATRLQTGLASDKPKDEASLMFINFTPFQLKTSGLSRCNATEKNLNVVRGFSIYWVGLATIPFCFNFHSAGSWVSVKSGTHYTSSRHDRTFTIIMLSSIGDDIGIPQLSY